MNDISMFPLSAFRVFFQIPELLDNMESQISGSNGYDLDALNGHAEAKVPNQGWLRGVLFWLIFWLVALCLMGFFWFVFFFMNKKIHTARSETMLW